MNTITQSEIELSERLQKACLERGITELRFVAQDSDGEWWHYTTMPTERNQAWGNCVGNTFLFIGKNTVNWRETLMEWNPNAGVPIAEMQQLERELAEVTKQRDAFRDELSKVMPPDYKDWWENDKNEWPIVARLTIESKRRLIDIDQETIERLERELTEITKQRDDLLESLKEVMPYIVGDRCVPWKKAQDAIDRATEGGAA